MFITFIDSFETERISSIIMACVILHNITVWMNEPELPDDQEEEMPNINAVEKKGQ